MDFKANYMEILAGLFSLTLLILAGVNYGSISKIKETGEDKRNAERSSQGVLALSVVLFLLAAYKLYEVYPKSSNVIYYF
jgi:hypothetical protein